MTDHYDSALLTGASSGIGEAMARVLSARGTSLVLVARRTDRLQALATELGGDIEVIGADLGTADGLDGVVERLHARPVELLINNAGVSTTGRFQTTDPVAEANEVRVNVVAVHALTRAAVEPMVAAGRGGILNVSSIAGEQPLRALATYAASKAFVTAFTESIAADLQGTGVHVTLLKPGYVATEMNPDAPDPTTRAGRFWLQAEPVAAAAIDAVERGKLMCVPGAHWRLASEMIQAMPRQLVRSLTTRFSAA